MGKIKKRISRVELTNTIVLLVFRFIIITYNSNKVQSKEPKKYKISSIDSVKTDNFTVLRQKTGRIPIVF